MILQSIKWQRAHSQWDERKPCVRSEGHSSWEGKPDPQQGRSIRHCLHLLTQTCWLWNAPARAAARTEGASVPWGKSPKKQHLVLGLSLSSFHKHPIPTLHRVFFFLRVASDTALNQTEVLLPSPPNQAGISLLKMWRGTCSFPALLPPAAFLSQSHQQWQQNKVGLELTRKCLPEVVRCFINSFIFYLGISPTELFHLALQSSRAPL